MVKKQRHLIEDKKGKTVVREMNIITEDDSSIQYEPKEKSQKIKKYIKKNLLKDISHTDLVPTRLFSLWAAQHV